MENEIKLTDISVLRKINLSNDEIDDILKVIHVLNNREKRLSKNILTSFHKPVQVKNDELKELENQRKIILLLFLGWTIKESYDELLVFENSNKLDFFNETLLNVLNDLKYNSLFEKTQMVNTL